LGFGGEGKGRKCLWIGKPLFGSFNKIRKCLGDFEGLHLSNFKVPPNWGVKHTN